MLLLASAMVEIWRGRWWWMWLPQSLLLLPPPLPELPCRAIAATAAAAAAAAAAPPLVASIELFPLDKDADAGTASAPAIWQAAMLSLVSLFVCHKTSLSRRLQNIRWIGWEMPGFARDYESGLAGRMCRGHDRGACPRCETGSAIYHSGGSPPSPALEMTITCDRWCVFYWVLTSHAHGNFDDCVSFTNYKDFHEVSLTHRPRKARFITGYTSDLI